MCVITLSTMAGLVLCVLALIATGGLADPVSPILEKPADHTCLEHQRQILSLFFHTHEPIHFKELQEIEHSWNLSKNMDLYENRTAVEISIRVEKENWYLPRGMPFLLAEYSHRMETTIFFNLLFSAKTFDTFFKTAVYLRPRVNEYLFVYILSTAVFHRHDTQGITVPPFYSTFPSFFHNAEIMTTAQRINTHGQHHVKYYPSTYIWENNVVIKANETLWPYFYLDRPIAYFTHDPALGNLYYSLQLTYPKWLGRDTCPLVKDRRGEIFWWWHRQLLTRYYMERLSNGLGEIPELDGQVVNEGYTSGLTYWNGVALPSRPDHFHLDSPWMVKKIQEIEEYESRVRDAIDRGYIITDSGKHLDIRNPEAIDTLGLIIDSNVDSPNVRYYKDLISMWKNVLGSTRVQEPTLVLNKFFPMVLPSPLELYSTGTRDPALYMIWKRVFQLFDQWHDQLPEYTPEELGLPSVTIDKVDVSKLVTYFEYTHYNVTNHLHMDVVEGVKTSVLVERAQLNHKVYTTRVHVKSDAPKHVTVRIFLAPKYDSMGQEIPIHVNSHNFFNLDKFDYELKEGDNVITRESTQTQWPFASDDLYEGDELYQKVNEALQGHGEFVLDMMHRPDAPARRLLLPKGRVGGMPFVFMVHISEYHAPKEAFGTGFDPVTSYGLGSGTRRATSDPLGFPVDRPLHEWQLPGLTNIWFEDVLIYHKDTPEVVVYHGH